jgi:hypothetical protein
LGRREPRAGTGYGLAEMGSRRGDLGKLLPSLQMATPELHGEKRQWEASAMGEEGERAQEKQMGERES